LATLKVIKDDDPALRKLSREVDQISPRISRLLDDMIETLHEYDGCGLAAPQVGVLRRIAIVEAEPGKIYELINPKIIERSGEHQQEVEGCLSLPGRWGITDRPEKVTVRAKNRKGETYEVTGSGLAARAFCHEIDHLDGVLFTDNALKILTEEELRKLREDDE
jgi:peptide deformylase